MLSTSTDVSSETKVQKARCFPDIGFVESSELRRHSSCSTHHPDHPDHPVLSIANTGLNIITGSFDSLKIQHFAGEDHRATLARISIERNRRTT